MSDSLGKPQTRGVLIIALSSIFFGLMAVLARTVSATVPWAELVTLRHGVGVIGVLIFFALRRKRPRFANPLALLLRGVFGGLAVLLYFFAIHALGAGPATVLNYVAPVYAAIWAMVFLKERTTAFTWLGLVLATSGAALVTFASTSGGTVSLPGALAGVASGIFGGAAMTAVKVARADSDAMTVFLCFGFVGGVMAAPVAVSSWVWVDGPTMLSVLLVGILALIAQLLFTWGMGHTSATVGSATTQLVPACVWVFSTTLLHEPISALSLTGALLCVAGVVVGLVRTASRTLVS